MTCECNAQFTCRRCLDRAVERMRAERNAEPFTPISLPPPTGAPQYPWCHWGVRLVFDGDGALVHPNGVSCWSHNHELFMIFRDTP